eukprot:ANDGO_01136.mRNA.1 Neutral alpha-glucosidase AB
MMRFTWFAVLIVSAAVVGVSCFDQSKFKQCRDQDFCKHLRDLAHLPESGHFSVDSSSFTYGKSLGFTLSNKLNAEAKFLEHGIVRLSLESIGQERPFSLSDVLLPRATHRQYTIQPPSTHTRESLVLTNGDSLVSVKTSPFRFSVGRNDNKAQVEMNANDQLQVLEEPSSSWASDFRLYGVSAIYGVPEHALDLHVPQTVDTLLKKEGSENANAEPIRLWNSDVFEYEINNKVGLYGSIPLVIGQGEHGVVGIFVMNGGQIFVDVSYADDAYVDVRFIAEEHPIDIFFFQGDSVRSILQKYAFLTGTTPLPQLFSLGYHQCRWNYRDEQDVLMINSEFNRYGIPLDVIWLDIEHTNGKRYFTWDKLLFPSPKAMQDRVAADGRKMVTISDPHIKRVDDYHVHKTAVERNYYVKKSQGSNEDYEGWCWSGSSSWLDFVNPEVRNWYGSLFSYDSYEGATPNLYTWIDMNEPSVFNGPEISMDKQAVHHGNVPHSRLHNLYGFYHSMATYDGLVKRNKDLNDRPFILTRSFYAGSQRYAAVWTGDNTATWEHLKASIPMLLTLGLSGIPFVGADVGGFFGNPDTELWVRWNEAAAWQPFFRGHAHLETKRREPWVFGDDIAAQMARITSGRYSFLPVWYTLFWEHEHSGVPAMRPVFLAKGLENSSSFWKSQDTFMLGDGILVRPVTEAGSVEAAVRLPCASSWYHLSTFAKYECDSNSDHDAKTHSVPAPIGVTPVFLRSGYIFSRRERPRRSSAQMLGDPFTLVVVADKKGLASGILYLDDGHSFDYTAEKGSKFSVRRFSLEGNIIQNSAGDLVGVAAPWSPLSQQRALPSRFDDGSVVDKVVVLGLSKQPSGVFLESDAADATSGIDNTLLREKKSFIWDASKSVLTVEAIRAPTVKNWKLVLIA